MLVSVITVCWNSEKTIRKTLESVLAQTYDHLEYLIIDGLSTDGTLDAVREYVERFAARGYTLRIVSEKDNGIYDAMNKGIRLASGDLIGIINSDDWYEPHAVETAVKAYLESPYDLFYADINLIREDGSVIVKRSRMDRFPSSRHWNHPTTFIPKAAYAELGLYRGIGIHDDFDLILRFRRAGKRIVIKHEVLANFRTGGVSNQKSLKKSWKRCRDRYRCYRDNGYSRLSMLECIAMEAAKFILS